MNPSSKTAAAGQLWLALIECERVLGTVLKLFYQATPPTDAEILARIDREASEARIRVRFDLSWAIQCDDNLEAFIGAAETVLGFTRSSPEPGSCFRTEFRDANQEDGQQPLLLELTGEGLSLALVDHGSGDTVRTAFQSVDDLVRILAKQLADRASGASSAG